MKKITSKDNPAYRDLQRLARSGRERRAAGLTILDGDHLMRAYREAFGAEGMKVVVRASQAQLPEAMAWVEAGGEALVLADGLFDSIAPVETPSGVLAVVRVRAVPVPDASKGFSVLIDGVQDPGNLGSILRSAAAAGGGAAYLSSDCVDPWSPKCLRGGMGAHFVLSIAERAQLTGVAQRLGARMIALEASATRSLFEADLAARPLAFILGSEGAGISPPLSELAHERVRVPMAPGVESLNVGAAAAVCFFEWRRRQGG